MSETPSDLKYTKSHEWARVLEDGRVEVGITDHAQEMMGDMVFVDVPEVGRQVAAGDECAVVESVKAASDVYAPVSGEIVETNALLTDAPELVNTQPYGDGWIYRIRPSDAAEIGGLLDATAYEASVEAED